MILALLLAVSISSPQIGTFFNLNGMIPGSVPADRTFGSDDATNSTHRLDPQEQAAVNAVFEAYYERVYYGNAGLSNVWNEADYGPECRGGTGLDRFRFWPDAAAGKASFHYEPDSNRVIRTRRLVEYDNLRYLCSVAINEFPSALSHLFRPSWERVAKSGSYYPISASPAWSSSLFDGLTLEHGRPETELPDVAWRPKPSFLSSKDRYFWSNMSLVLSDLQTDYRNDPVNWGYGQGKPCFVAALLDAIDFGDPPSESDMYTGGYLYFPSTVTNTTMDVVGRGYAVTNIVYSPPIERTIERTVELTTADSTTGPMASGNVINAFENVLRNMFDTSGSGVFSMSLSPDIYINFNEIIVPLDSMVVHNDEVFIPLFDVCYSAGGRVIEAEFEPLSPVVDIPYVYDADSGTVTEEDPVRTLGRLTYKYAVPVTNITYHAGLDGLTNETRRLVSDNCAALGLGLSALDRSYCEVAHAIPNVVSNWYGTARRNYSSGTYGAPFGPFVWSDGEWRASLSSEEKVPVLEETSVYSSVNSVGSTSFSDYVIYANPAGFGFNCSTFLDPGSAPSTPEVSMEDIVGKIEASWYVPDNPTFYTVVAAGFSPPDGSITLDIEVSGDVYGADTWRFGTPESPTNAVLETSAFASTGYNFGHTFPAGTRLDRREGFAPYPGDYTRVDRSDPPVLWTVFARCGKFGTDRLHQWTEIYNEYGSMREISYSPAYAPETVCEYSSAASSPFTSSAQAFAAADNHFLRLASGCSGLFSSRCGFDFHDPVGMLDYVSEGLTASNTLANIVLGANAGIVASVGFGREYGCVSYFAVTGNGSGGVGSIKAMEFVGPDPVVVPFPVRLYTIDYTLQDDTRIKEGHEPAEHDFNGGAVAGRMTSLSRVNWDWKALKRERNNQ